MQPRLGASVEAAGLWSNHELGHNVYHDFDSDVADDFDNAIVFTSLSMTLIMTLMMTLIMILIMEHEFDHGVNIVHLHTKMNERSAGDLAIAQGSTTNVAFCTWVQVMCRQHSQLVKQAG